MDANQTSTFISIRLLNDDDVINQIDDNKNARSFFLTLLFVCNSFCHVLLLKYDVNVGDRMNEYSLSSKLVSFNLENVHSSFSFTPIR